MAEHNTLVLPPYNTERNAGGPVAVVNLLRKGDSRNYFTFIEAEIKEGNSGTIERGKELIRSQGLITTTRKFVFERIKNSLIGVINHRMNAKKTVEKYREEISGHQKIICMKVYLANEINKQFPNKDVVLVYQGQGSRYNELCDLDGMSENLLGKRISDITEKKAYKESSKIVLPSQGAAEALKKTNKRLEKILTKDNYRIIHNAIDIQNINSLDEEFPYKLKLKDEELLITTVSSCNEAKGVEKIPSLLKKLKKSGINFKWVLIGSGPKESEIESEIKKNNLNKDTIWFKEKFERGEILDLFSKSDIYVMRHRISILDLATIEAMALGNLPILSRVGGNKEFNIDNNVIFDDEIGDKLDFIKEKISEKKKKNQKISRNKFNSREMFKQYKEVVESL